MENYETLFIGKSNINKQNDIAEHLNCEPLANNVLKCVIKYRNHPSILTIREVCNKHPRLLFSFSKINTEGILREILKSETSKACQDTDILKKNYQRECE